jgi:hypothetical protein
MGVLTLFFSFFGFLKGPYQFAHHQFVWNIGHSSTEAPLWTTSCKIDTNVLSMVYLFSLYTWELNFGQTIWDKTEVLWGAFRVTTWEPGELMGTHTEHDENKEKRQKKKPTPPPSYQVLKRKNLDPSWVHAEPFIGCMRLLFPKLFVTIFIMG